MIAISACLMGHRCRFDGKMIDRVIDLEKLGIDKSEVITVCPECLGGLTSPRCPCEILGGEGHDVLCSRARVVGQKGGDFTKEFIKGAYAALDIVQKNGVEMAILKPKSPSCGVNQIYDGSFSGKLVGGSGVFAALLRQNGIIVREPQSNELKA